MTCRVVIFFYVKTVSEFHFLDNTSTVTYGGAILLFLHNGYRFSDNEQLY